MLNFYPRPPRGGRPACTGVKASFLTFLSTPSARRATFRDDPPAGCRWISIHALREEGDIRYFFKHKRILNFYPRPPRGGRLFPPTGLLSSFQFLSTPSARRATFIDDVLVKLLQFLSTPSARRATLTSAVLSCSATISIHALREEGDLVFYRGQQNRIISIHALREEGDNCPRIVV